MGRSCSQNRRGRSVFKILTGTLIGKRSLGRPRRRCEGNIIMDLKEVGINTRNWVKSTQNMDYWRGFLNSALNSGLHNPRS